MFERNIKHKGTKMNLVVFEKLTKSTRRFQSKPKVFLFSLRHVKTLFKKSLNKEMSSYELESHTPLTHLINDWTHKVKNLQNRTFKVLMERETVLGNSRCVTASEERLWSAAVVYINRKTGNVERRL